MWCWLTDLPVRRLGMVRLTQESRRILERHAKTVMPTSDVERSKRIDKAVNHDNTVRFNVVFSSKWNETHLVLGAYHFWVDDTGRLRIKLGQPIAQDDGDIVGLQS